MSAIIEKAKSAIHKIVPKSGDKPFDPMADDSLPGHYVPASGGMYDAGPNFEKTVGAADKPASSSETSAESSPVESESSSLAGRSGSSGEGAEEGGSS